MPKNETAIITKFLHLIKFFQRENYAIQSTAVQLVKWLYRADNQG
jgi:hypothetical protein